MICRSHHSLPPTAAAARNRGILSGYRWGADWSESMLPAKNRTGMMEI
jgi:hypothetical protein